MLPPIKSPIFIAAAALTASLGFQAPVEISVAISIIWGFSAVIFGKSRRDQAKLKLQREIWAGWIASNQDLMSVAETSVPVLERKFTWINVRVWRNLLGWSEEELLDMPIVNLLHPVEFESVVQGVHDHQQERDSHQDPEHQNRNETICRLLCSDGTYIITQWISVASGGRLYSSGRDITALVETLETLDRRNRDLEEFSSVAAHQLKSPARTILGMCEALIEDIENPTPAVTELMDHILKAAVRMGETVTALHEFTKLKVAPFERNPHSVAHVLAEAIDSAELDPRVQIKDETQSNECYVHCNKALLVQGLVNILQNAAKFNHLPASQRRILIHVEETDGVVSVLIHDNGIGISDLARAKLFKIFQRGTSAFKGSGVGLALSKAVFEAHGGHITADNSDRLGGAVIEVMLPCVSSQTSIPSQS